MAKIARATQKRFGSGAAAGQIAAFGSAANSGFSGGTTYSGATATPALVQALSVWLDGWFTAVDGLYNPAIEDANAVDWLFAYQLCYLFQAGVAEWDAGTTYYIGSLVSDGVGGIHCSVTDTNLNHAVTDGDYWRGIASNGITVPNTAPNTSIATGKSITWPFLTIPTGKTFTVATGAQLVSVSTIVISGTGNLIVSGTGIVRVL